MALVRRHASDWFEVEIERDAHRVIVRRLAPLFRSRDEGELACAPVLDVLDAIDRSTHTLLMDVRLARGVNDPEYESWYAPLRRDIVRDFRRVAIVVRSASGWLQAQRLASVDRDAGFRVFDDLGRAERYLDAP